MFRARLLEPLQCPVPLAEAFINDSEVLWWNVPSLRQRVHLLQHLMPLGPSARDAQRVPQIHQLQYAAMRFRGTLLQFGDGFPLAPGAAVLALASALIERQRLSKRQAYRVIRAALPRTEEQRNGF